MTTYDVIVIGTGGVGSAAVCHLARRGMRVLGLDQFSHGHDRGSSHGQTRIIRQAYHEHVDYVPIVLQAYELWEELERETGEQLLHRIGLLGIGSPESAVIRGIRSSAATPHLDIDELTAEEISRQFRCLRVPEGSLGLLECQAGYLFVERCVLAHLEIARRHCAELLTGQVVTDWESTGTHITVRTENAAYSAAQLIVAGGAWAGGLLAELQIPLRVVAKHVHWYTSDQRDIRQDAGCPVFFYEVPEGIFYGLPQIDKLGVKAAEHSGGTPVDDPSRLDRSVNPLDRARVEQFLDTWLPGVRGKANGHAACMYSFSPDEHFIVDLHPGFDNVAMAIGLSGHGFKFTSALGAALADLSMRRTTDLPIDFLRCSRFA